MIYATIISFYLQNLMHSINRDMPVADNSYAERLRRLRNRTLAIFHAKNPRLAESGPAVTPDSLRLDRQLGGMGYTIQPSENLSYETPLCCPAPEPVE